MARILIAGCGYVGGALAEQLAVDGHDVWGLRRRPGAVPRGVRPLQADLARADRLGGLPDSLDFVVYCASADASDESAYRAAYLDGLGNLLRVLAEQGERPRRIFFTSSTAVYGQRRGEWVDEDSPTDPARWNGEILLLAERLLRGSAFASTSLRLGGIYGPGRTRLIDTVREGRAVLRAGPPAFTNRIHRDDAAGALRHLMGCDELADCYVTVDSAPADEAEVLTWMARELGVPPPRQQEEDEALAPRRAGSKRCRNARLLETGWRLRYPSFREGYRALLSADASVAR